MKKTTIIVVDDSPFTSKQLKDVVEENGYEVIGYAKKGLLCMTNSILIL